MTPFLVPFFYGHFEIIEQENERLIHHQCKPVGQLGSTSWGKQPNHISKKIQTYLKYRDEEEEEEEKKKKG